MIILIHFILNVLRSTTVFSKYKGSEMENGLFDFGILSRKWWDEILTDNDMQFHKEEMDSNNEK